MGPIIRTCSLAACLVALAVPSEAWAARAEIARSSATTFVGARAAELAGDARRAAILYAALSQAEPGNRAIANRAISQAISAGDMNLALRLMGRRQPSDLAIDARLLLVADHLRSGREREALQVLRIERSGPDLGFLAPFVEAWNERRVERSLALLDKVPAGSAVAPFVDEHRALLLLRSGKAAAAEPVAARALAKAGARASRVRLALADGYMRARDRERAMAVLAGNQAELAAARGRVAAGRAPAEGVRNSREAFSELLTAVSVELGRADAGTLALAMAQVARHSSPGNPTAPILLAILLRDGGRLDDSLAVLRSLPDDHVFVAQARDAEVRGLIGSDRNEEALARASAFVASGRPSADDWSRLADVLDEMKRPGPAADAYGRALALVQAGAPGAEAWQLHLLRGAMLEQAERWPEAKQSLEAARRLSPDNPLVLNFLGYAQLERGENLDSAEALIAEAHKLAPDDASITDSLGWAQFKRGRVEEAIVTLQRAAAGDAAESEIHEHLGDALYTAGRRFEARHAWRAALLTAEDDVKQRIEAKIGAGLSPANAAP